MTVIGFWIGWLGVLFGLCVAPPQLIKIIRTGKCNDVSVWTYSFLCAALLCYLIHAIYIHSIVFTVAQSVNLTTNGVVLWLLIRRK